MFVYKERTVLKIAIKRINLVDALGLADPYDNPVEGIELLDLLGLAPAEGDGFGRKAARFGLGLATDIVTDPLSWVAGGITKPLTLLKSPVIGKTAATLTKQGMAQPFLRGVGAGLRGTGALGAAVGDAGVLEARKAAVEAARVSGGKEAVQKAATLNAPRALTRSEQLGLRLGTGVKENDLARGFVKAFSPNALSDPAYVRLRTTLARNLSKAQRGKLKGLEEVVKGLTPEDQRLVADLLESSAARSQYGLESFPSVLRSADSKPPSLSSSAPNAELSPIQARSAPPTQFPSGRTPSQNLPAFPRPSVGRTADVLPEHVTAAGNLRVEIGEKASLSAAGVVLDPLNLRNAKAPDLMQEFARQIEQAYKGDSSGLGYVVLELVRRGTWEDAARRLPLRFKRVYEELLKKEAHPFLVRLVDSDDVARQSLQETFARRIAKVSDRDQRATLGFWLDKTMRDAVPLNPPTGVSGGGTRAVTGAPLPSGRQPGTTLPTQPTSARGHSINLGADDLGPDGSYRVKIDSKNVVTSTKNEVTPEAIRKYSDTDLLQEFAYRAQANDVATLRDLSLEMVRRGIWEDGSKRIPLTIRQAYERLRTRLPILPAVGASDESIRAFLSQQSDSALSGITDQDEKLLNLLRVNTTLRDAVPLTPTGNVVDAGVRTGATQADAMTERLLEVQSQAAGLTDKGITAANPLEVARPGMDRTRRLFETEAVKELPENVRKAYEFAKGTLETYGNERLRRGLLAALMDNYFPHKLNPDLVDDLPGVATNRPSTTQGSANYREVSRNKTLAELSSDPNALQFEREVVRPLAREILESERAVQSFDFFDEVTRQFGIKADDMARRFGFTPGGKMPDVVGDYKLVDFQEFFVRAKERESFAKLGQVYLPKNVADDLTRLHAAYNTDEGIGSFLKLWDGATNFWKPLVTSLQPSFHVNNFLGNLWNSYLGGMTNPYRLRDGYDVFLNRLGGVKAGNHKLSFEQLHELGNRNGVIGGGFFEVETGRDPFRLAREGLPKPVSENNIRKVLQGIQAGGRKVGTFVEGVNRSALFADQMIKKVEQHAGELTADALEKYAQEAADHVNMYLFDYAHGLSRFENEVMRRIAPFYSWSRFNIPRQIVELIDQPGKFLVFKHTKDNLVRLNPYPDDTPPWLRESLPTGATMDGSPLFFNPRLPLQDISRLAPGDSGKELLGMLNPFIKLPIELGVNKSFYTGRAIEEYPGQTTQILGGARIPTKAVYAAQSTLGAVGKAGSALQAFTPDADATDKLRLIRYVFPGLYSYNVKRQPISNAYSEVQRLRDLMRKFEDESGKEVPTTRQMRQMGLVR